VLTLVKLDHYCAVVTQWQDQMTQALANGVRRYRKERGMSTQQLADRTAELGMPIRRSVLANLENGRRESVSVTELLLLAAALDAAPIDLFYPVGLEERIEMLPGRMADSLGVVSWFCGDLKLDLAAESTALRTPNAGEESNVYLIRYHNGMIDRLRAHEAEAARARADVFTEVAAAEAVAAEAEAHIRARTAEAAAEWEARDAALREARDATAAKVESVISEAAYRETVLEEWINFMREPLRRTRAEMRRRGVLLPAVPPRLSLDEEDTGPATHVL
jgi:transcriptional regulator with XRE-family HTH domain